MVKHVYFFCIFSWVLQLSWKGQFSWIFTKPPRFPLKILSFIFHIQDISSREFIFVYGLKLEYSCLENPVDRGAWWAAVHRVTQSQTQLKWLGMHARTGEGNGNPLQYSCLENPRDRGVWWAAVYGVAQSQTRLKWLSSSNNFLFNDYSVVTASCVKISYWIKYHLCFILNSFSIRIYFWNFSLVY